METLSFSHVVACFLDIAKRYENKAAIKYKDEEITYKELDAWSDRVAAELRRRGVQTDEGVGIIAGRCPQLAVAMLGILKAGAFYIPINEEEPASKIDFFLQDSMIHLLCLTSKHWKNNRPACQTLAIDDCRYSEHEDSGYECMASRLVYRMYTSGTTGVPKGCDITHKNILNFVLNQSFFHFNSRQVLLQTSSPAFDACTFEVWGTLLHGATLVFTEKINLLGADTLKMVFQQYKITGLLMTTSLFHQLCEQDPAIFDTLEHLIVGGSALSVKHIKKVKTYCPQLALTNAYGPTENTVVAACHLIRDQDLKKSRIPIGAALNGVNIFIMNPQDQPVERGEIGELCIGGDSLCSGYFNRDELNKEKFFVYQGMTLYRTGDYALEIEPGIYDYMGRTDHQIKIQGYRVELSEIEHVLAHIEGIDEVVVRVIDAGGAKQIAAYYTGSTDASPEQLRQFAMDNLQEYMLPAKWTKLPHIPLNANWKVDFKQLDEYDKGIDASERRILEQLKELTHQVYYGGFEVSSIPLAQAELLRLASRLGISIADFYRASNIRELAQMVWQKNSSAAPAEEEDELLKELLEGI